MTTKNNKHATTQDKPTPEGIFTQSFLESYNEDDTFFMYDHQGSQFGESLSEAISRHLQAGRLHLAAALQQHQFASSLRR